MAHGVTGPGGAGGNAPVTRASGVAARHTSPAGEFAGENASGCARWNGHRAGSGAGPARLAARAGRRSPPPRGSGMRAAVRPPCAQGCRLTPRLLAGPDARRPVAGPVRCWTRTR